MTADPLMPRLDRPCPGATHTLTDPTRPSGILTRRAALTGIAAAGAALMAGPALSAAQMLGPLRQTANRVKLGGFEVTTILDGAVVLDGPYPIFGGYASEAEVQALAAENKLPPSKLEIGFTPVLVNTGKELILFDTGNGAGTRPARGNLRPGLAAAGYTPEDVDIVVITHMHPDHIGGIMEDGAPAYRNATYVTAAAEYDFWSPEDKLSGGTERVTKIVRASLVPMVEKIRFIKPGDSVVSGIEAIDASGHTPGQMAYHIESEGKRLVLIADVANHFVVALQRPDWHVRFDMDKEKAVATRKSILGMIAADGVPFTGYHMPFPAMGWLSPKGPGYEFIPATYQFAAGG